MSLKSSLEMSGGDIVSTLLISNWESTNNSEIFWKSFLFVDGTGRHGTYLFFKGTYRKASLPVITAR